MRKRSGVKRVGHAGTLDPAATGVLPVCLGNATRLVEYLVDSTKTYIADVCLGTETDTYDLDGTVMATQDASGIGLDDISSALEGFRGEIEQVPPAFSAIKRAGVPAYKLARKGEAVQLEPRRVRIDRLELVAYEAPTLRLEIECSKGFYVRSLAHDLGAALGVGGTLATLVRTRVGSFRMSDAVGIETLTRAFEDDSWREHLFAPDEVLLGWQAAVLGDRNVARVRNGLPALLTATPSDAQRCRAYSTEGDLVAVLRRAGLDAWAPDKVLI